MLKNINVAESQKEEYQNQFTQILSDRYEFKQLKGQGSYGLVAHIYDKKIKQDIAIKKTRILQHKHQALSFLREIDILKNLKSNLVLKLKYVLCIPEKNSFRAYIATDLWPTDMYQILMDKEVQITEDHQKFFAYQIILAIYYLHEQKILHRDLKSSNILINKDSELALCDFNLSRFAMQDAEYTKYVATRFYRAPELISQKFEYDGKIDVWSFGCIFYEILARKILFKANSTKKLKEIFLNKFGPCKDLLMHANKLEKKIIACPLKEPIKISSYLKDQNINKDALDLLDKCLNLNPNKRITAYEALKHDYFKDYFEEQHIDFKRQHFKERLEIEENFDLNQLQEEIIKTVNDLNSQSNEQQYRWKNNKLEILKYPKNKTKLKKIQLHLQMKFITLILMFNVICMKVQIFSPESLKKIFIQKNKNNIPYTVSTFGDISYLKKSKFQIIAPDNQDNETGCKELKISKSKQSKNFVWLIKRTYCTYSQKAYNAQKSGAKAVIVYHNDPNQNIQQVLVVNDPAYTDINIPVILISYNDGAEIRKQLQSDEILQINKPGKPTKIVDTEFWMNPLSIQSYEFIIGFQKTLQQFNRKIRFTPKYKFKNLVGAFDQRFLSQHCVSKGSFCELDSRFFNPVSTIMEGIRQICVWDLSIKQTGSGDLWWQYIKYYKQWLQSHYFQTGRRLNNDLKLQRQYEREERKQRRKEEREKKKEQKKEQQQAYQTQHKEDSNENSNVNNTVEKNVKNTVDNKVNNSVDNNVNNTEDNKVDNKVDNVVNNTTNKKEESKEEDTKQNSVLNRQDNKVENIRTNLKCDDYIFEQISLNEDQKTQIQQCIDKSFSIEYDYFDSTNKLLEENKNSEKYELVYIVPVFLVNNQIVKENLSNNIVKGAICEKLIDQPQFCNEALEAFIEDDFQEEKNQKNQTTKILLLIIGLIVLFILIILIVQKILKIRFQEEINRQIQNTITEYTRIGQQIIQNIIIIIILNIMTQIFEKLNSIIHQSKLKST